MALLCAYCNSEIAWRTEACPHCGARIPPEVQATIPAPPTNQATAPPAGYDPPQAASSQAPAGQYPYPAQQSQPGAQPFQPPYPQQPMPYVPVQPQARTTPNTLGIVAIVLLFIFPLAGIGCAAAGLSIYQTDVGRGLNPPSNYRVICTVALALNALRFFGTIVLYMLRALY